MEGKGVVVKTSTRQTVFLPVPGLVRANEVKPGELVGVNKVSNTFAPCSHCICIAVGWCFLLGFRVKSIEMWVCE